jgi:predicted enzyme related to lactoylglutathione lyase
MSETSVAIRAGQIVWHDLMTPDVAGAQRFYGELLGWSFNVWKPGEFDYPMIRVGESDHGGIFGQDPSQGVPPHWVAYVRADDVDAATARAAAAGGSILAEARDIPEVGRFAVIADPQGAVIAPFAAGYEAPPPQGTFVWEELHTPDPAAAKQFYSEVFGWRASEMDMGDLGTYGLFGLGEEDSLAGVFQKSADEPGPAYWLTYLAVDDVDAATAKAIGLGATQLLAPMTIEGVGRWSILTDPTGASFGLYRSLSE